MVKTEKLSIRGPYDPSLGQKLLFPNPTMAKQSFKAECDINTIMAKYEETGLVSHANNIQGAYGDFSDAEDYHTSVNRVMAANDAFMALPSKVRLRFNNNAGDFLAFMEDENNRDEAASLGLLETTSTAQNEPSKPAPKETKSPEGDKTPSGQTKSEENSEK